MPDVTETRLHSGATWSVRCATASSMRSARRLASETGLAHLPAEAGDPVAGVYRRRLSLASGRFAMIDNGLGFQLVPWIPSLERELGRQVNGIAGPGGVDWNFGRKRDLSL